MAEPFVAIFLAGDDGGLVDGRRVGRGPQQGYEQGGGEACTVSVHGLRVGHLRSTP
ncbi:hypothetical protein D3C81_2284580 [compost metagenome]